MPDPFRSLFRSLDPERISRTARSPHEQIEWLDRVGHAAALIRRQELAVWFEADWYVALQIAARCPECAVFSVPPEAVLLDHLREPRPWRRGGAPKP